MRRTESVEWRRLLRENLHREKGVRQNQLEVPAVWPDAGSKRLVSVGGMETEPKAIGHFFL